MPNCQLCGHDRQDRVFTSHEGEGFGAFDCKNPDQPATSQRAGRRSDPRLRETGSGISRHTASAPATASARSRTARA